jgi:hypothetical protein
MTTIAQSLKLTSWVRGPSRPQTAVGPTLGPWVPKAHPSPLVAEMYVLGELYICRKAFEAHYDLYDPSCLLPILYGTLEKCRAEGERRWKLMTTQDVEAPGERPTDIAISDQGSIVLVMPRTPGANEWLTENVQDDAQWFGQSLVVERRFISHLIEGMMAEGLRISG